MPSLVARTCALRQFLTIPISALDAAEVGALARPEPGHEKRHVRRLRRRLEEYSGRRNQAKTNRGFHSKPLIFRSGFSNAGSWNYSFTKSWQRHLIQRLAATCDSYAIDAFICLSVPKRLRAF
jgi:hypothetical protein